MARIAVGGFEHETNTFAPSPATWAAFVEAGGMPPLCRGPQLVATLAGQNLAAAGFIAAAEAAGHEIVPLAWAAATPSAQVTTDAFERMAGLLLEDLAVAQAVGALDAVYLDLHGAMVTEAHEDGEGELLRRFRAAVGPQVALVASLDLHANVTRAMVDAADLLDAYRAYPHVDRAATGARVAAALDHMLAHRPARRRPLARAYRQLDFLVGLNWQCTLIEPARTLYARLAALAETDGVLALAFAQGFALADIHDAGGSVFAYGADQAAVDHVVEALAAAVAAREGDFAGRLWTPDEAVVHAMASDADTPTVLADTQDNPGGGGNADTVGLLAALVRHDARGAVLATLADAAAAAAAHAVGEGATITLGLGAKSGLPGHAPFAATFAVERLGDGRFTGTGPMWGGNPIDLGPMALLRVQAGGEGVGVIVASGKMQAGDQAIFRHLGVEPAAQRILALKSSVHFRADFQPIAAAVLVVAAPGPVTADTARLPYRNLRPGLRVAPFGPAFTRPLAG